MASFNCSSSSASCSAFFLFYVFSFSVHSPCLDLAELMFVIVNFVLLNFKAKLTCLDEAIVPDVVLFVGWFVTLTPQLSCSIDNRASIRPSIRPSFLDCLSQCICLARMS